MKILKVLIISIIIVISLSQSVFAIGEVFETAKSFEQASNNYMSTTLDSKNLKTQSDKIYNLLLAIAIGVAVVVGAILAIRFMTAGIDKKVEVKEALFPYLVSCIVVFGSMGIWKLVVNVLNSAKPDLSSVTVQSSPSTPGTQSSATHQSSGGGVYGGGGSNF